MRHGRLHRLRRPAILLLFLAVGGCKTATRPYEAATPAEVTHTNAGAALNRSPTHGSISIRSIHRVSDARSARTMATRPGSKQRRGGLA